MFEKSPFHNQGLALLVIHANDMQKSVEFYRSLGLRFERHSHPPCGVHFATVDGNCVFEICQRRQDRPPHSPITFGFNVSSVEDAVNEARASGGTVKREPHGAEWGRSATLADPDGNCVLLMESHPQVSVDV